MPPNKSMSSNDQDRIFELLQDLNRKFEEYQKATSDAASRLAGVEATQRAQTEMSNRFWNTNWPAEQKMIGMMEERIRELEKGRVTAEKVDKIEERIIELGEKLDQRLADVATSTAFEKLEARLSSQEKVSAETGTKFSMTHGILTFVGSALVTALFHLIVKKFGS